MRSPRLRSPIYLTSKHEVTSKSRKCSPTTKTRNSCNCLYIFQNCSLCVYISPRGVLASNSPPCNMLSRPLHNTTPHNARSPRPLWNNRASLLLLLAHGSDPSCSMLAWTWRGTCSSYARCCVSGPPPAAPPRTARRPSVAHRENLCELSPWPCSGAPVSIRAPVSCMLHIVFPK